MKVEEKLAILEKLREESVQNGSRINGAVVNTDVEETKGALSGFAFRSFLALVLAMMVFLMNTSDHAGAKEVADYVEKAVVVDFIPDIPYNQIDEKLQSITSATGI